MTNLPDPSADEAVPVSATEASASAAADVPADGAATAAAAPEPADETLAAAASDTGDGAPAEAGTEAMDAGAEPSAETAGDGTPETDDGLPIAAAVAEPPAPPALDAAAEPAPQGRRRSLAMRFAVAFLIGVALVVGIGAGALYAWGQQYEGRVLPGVQVGSTDLSGMTRDEAKAAIAAAYASLGQGAIVLNGPTGQTTIAYASIDRGPDTEAILEAALAAGRQGAPLADLIGAPQAALRGVTVASAVTYDRAKLAAAVHAAAASSESAPQDATLTEANDGSFVVTPAVEGRSVDEAAILAALEPQLSKLDAPAQVAADVSVTPIAPKVATAVAETAKATADRMVADLVLARDPDSWTITSEQLRPMVTISTGVDGSITPVFDGSGLDGILTDLATKVNQSAQDASIKLSGGHIVADGTSREGRTLDVAATKAAIEVQMAARQAGTATEPVGAVVLAVAPKMSRAQADDYAANMKVISSFSVYYWVIINNHYGGNIEGPATKINGTVVDAGATFDFWKVVGDLHKVPGVGPGNAIENGKITVTGAFGGGICTTSTTLFNAAFRAGMIPGARKNHNEFIDRYPPGLDATVWIVGSAKQTMSFTNDTESPIVIQRVITKAGSKRWLTFKIWSVPNGRTAKVSNTVIQAGKKAIDIVQKDPTKPVGYRYRNNAPADGKRVWTTVTIYDHGKVHWTKRYYSNYPPVNGVLIVGTKGSTPSPSPSPSPTPAP